MDEVQLRQDYLAQFRSWPIQSDIVGSTLDLVLNLRRQLSPEAVVLDVGEEMGNIASSSLSTTILHLIWGLIMICQFRRWIPWRML